jgi:excisionase family DNA binding protein
MDVMLMSENDKISITVNEAAKMLGVGRNTMLEFVKMDGFPAIRLKRKILIDKEALPKWFANSYGKYTY